MTLTKSPLKKYKYYVKKTVYHSKTKLSCKWSSNYGPSTLMNSMVESISVKTLNNLYWTRPKTNVQSVNAVSKAKNTI